MVLSTWVGVHLASRQLELGKSLIWNVPEGSALQPQVTSDRRHPDPGPTSNTG
jgi:hypothetical protein